MVGEHIELRLLRAGRAVQLLATAQAEQVPVEDQRARPLAARGVTVGGEAPGDHLVARRDRLDRGVEGVEHAPVVLGGEALAALVLRRQVDAEVRLRPELPPPDLRQRTGPGIRRIDEPARVAGGDRRREVAEGTGIGLPGSWFEILYREIGPVRPLGPARRAGDEEHHLEALRGRVAHRRVDPLPRIGGVRRIARVKARRGARGRNVGPARPEQHDPRAGLRGTVEPEIADRRIRIHEELIAEAREAELERPGRLCGRGRDEGEAGHREGEGGHDEHTAAPHGTSREPGRAARPSCFGALVQGHVPLLRLRIDPCCRLPPARRSAYPVWLIRLRATNTIPAAVIASRISGSTSPIPSPSSPPSSESRTEPAPESEPPVPSEPLPAPDRP